MWEFQGCMGISPGKYLLHAMPNCTTPIAHVHDQWLLYIVHQCPCTMTENDAYMAMIYIHCSLPTHREYHYQVVRSWSCAQGCMTTACSTIVGSQTKVVLAQCQHYIVLINSCCSYRLKYNHAYNNIMTLLWNSKADKKILKYTLS